MTRHPELPTDEPTAAINADLLAGRIDHTGWWDDLGQPAPWPDDIDERRPTTSNTINFDF